MVLVLLQLTDCCSGTRPWRTLDDHPVKSATTVQGLIAGRPYQIRVVAKSDFGESASEMQEFVAGNDPGLLHDSFMCWIF